MEKKKTKIVVLDGYTANPGDLCWEELKKLGDCTIYERTSSEQLIERAKEADIILTNKNILRKEELEKLPNLKLVAVMATGYNIIDTEEARKKGVLVTNVPAYSTSSVAQMVFAHLLNICAQVEYHSQEVRAGRWTRNQDFCFWDKPLVELSGKTMGIVGLGQTGSATARMALALGMNIAVYSSKDMDGIIKSLNKDARGLDYSGARDNIRKLEMDDLFREADVISLHCPLTDNTRAMVSRERLKLMKTTSILINTGRGPLIDEQAVADALNNGEIYAAGVDVLSQEPPKDDNPLLTAKNAYITPHIAWATKEARMRLMGVLIENVKAFLEGKPINVVN